MKGTETNMDKDSQLLRWMVKALKERFKVHCFFHLSCSKMFIF